jgi:hypothetical protein
MTIETRTTVQLSDIKAIEFECAKCHAKSIFQIGKFDNPPLNCGACGGEPWFVANTPDRSDIAKLAQIITRFSGQPSSGFAMRLEVRGVSASREGA